MEMRPASTRGRAAPAAKGMAVKGTSAIETALFHVSQSSLLQSATFAYGGVAPLEAPVVAAVGGVRRRSRHGVVQGALDDLRKRREDLSCCAGLESGSRDRLENGLAPLHAEGGHDGGSKGALRGRGHSLAHERGTERGGHGVWRILESGEESLEGRGGVVVGSARPTIGDSRRCTGGRPSAAGSRSAVSKVMRCELEASAVICA